MARLLDDLLDSTRIARGQLLLQIAPANLAEIVKEAVAVATPLIEKNNHSLEVRLPDAPITLRVDAVRISQVLSNLLTNAAKYSDPGGQIILDVKSEIDQFSIKISDTGIGIHADAIPGLFSMFSQLQSPVDRTEGGLGIGLAFSNELVKLHGGHIDVHSAGAGCGSEFVVILPSTMVLHRSESSVPRPPTLARLGFPPLVLVADDNVDAAESLGMLLEMAGCEVLLVRDGVEAVKLAQQRRPQVAVLDIGMPGLNGYQVAEQIRAAGWGKEVLLIAATGWGQAADKARALAAGFDHHLTKPIDSDQLEALIFEHVRPAVNADVSTGQPNGQLKRLQRRLADGQRSVSIVRNSDLLEANEQLVLAALQAETLATTAEQHLSELARSSQRDVLTNTPNRALMLDRLENALAMAHRHATHVAVLFVDIDHFKQINDTFGHAVGDEVLQQAARRFESVVRASDAVSRHGGDEFLVLLTEISQRSDAAAIAAKMMVALTESALTGTPMPPVSASIGISVYPEDGADAASLINRADGAMYCAKQSGRNRFEFYTAQ